MNLPEKLPMPNHMEKKDILNLLLTEEYGFLPSVPYSITGKTQSSDQAFCAGKAAFEKISLTCQTEYGDFCFPVYFSCPTRQDKPLPCFILINFSDAVPDRCLPAEEIMDAGYAVLSFRYTDITSDDGDFTDGLAGLVYPNGRTSPTQCGKIGLWAWAASRVMDLALTLPVLDHSRVSVVGHSRLGKAALLAGALDDRFYCTFSNDSGCSGASLARGNRGETIQAIYHNFPYWFCENYGKYADREDSLPFDQHFLLAANVPHRVYVASAAQDQWADPQSEYLSCIAAGSYYEDLGLTGFIHPDRLPEPGDFFGDGMIGYHLRDGKHYLSREDWQRYIQYLEL